MAGTPDKYMQDIQKMSRGDVAKQQQDAYTHIIQDLLVNNVQGQDKVYELGGYDSESQMQSKIMPGCIYIMQYVSKQQSVYTVDSKTVIQFSDAEPLVFVTSVSGQTIRGINLNLCTYALKTIILNLVSNIDPDFFQGDAEQLASQRKVALSQKLMMFFGKGNAEQAINDYLQAAYKIKSYSAIFRTYNIQNIKKIRMVEPWQWKEIPYLNYTGTIKHDVLELIHKASGIAKITI